jgi:hypothetical protein
LEGPHKSVIKEQLKQMGMHRKLSEMINLSANFKFENHKNLLQLVYLFNATDPVEIGNEYNLLGGISITTTDEEHKSKYVQYCIAFLKRKVEPLYALAMGTLGEVFEEHSYFVDTISNSYFSSVLELIVDGNRETNVSALNLLRVIVFNSMSACDDLIEQYAALDYLFERLMLEKNLSYEEPFTKKSIEQCTNILCDLLMTRSSAIKKIMFKHHIWQLIF